MLCALQEGLPGQGCRQTALNAAGSTQYPAHAGAAAARTNHVLALVGLIQKLHTRLQPQRITAGRQRCTARAAAALER